MAYTLTEDGLGRQIKVPVFNESEDGTGVWHVPVCDSSGYLKVSLQTVNDDVPFKLGTGGTVSILYETADANANAAIFVAPEGGDTDVPAFIFGDASILNADLGWFNGLTEPSIVVVNDAKDAYIRIDSGDDGVAGSKGIYFKAAADEDIELMNLSVTGTPRDFWDESDDVRCWTGKYRMGGSVSATRLGQVLGLSAAAADTYGGLAITTWTSSTLTRAPIMDFNLSNSATEGQYTAVTAQGDLAYIQFRAADGTDWQQSSSILAKCIGTIGDNRVPGELQFHCFSDAAPSVNTQILTLNAARADIGKSCNFKRFYSIVTLDTGDAETAVGLTPGAVILTAAIRVSTQITGLDEAEHHIQLGINGNASKYIDVTQGASATTIDVNKKGKYTFDPTTDTEAAALVLTITAGADQIPTAGAVEVEVIYLDSTNLDNA